MHGLGIGHLAGTMANRAKLSPATDIRAYVGKRDGAVMTSATGAAGRDCPPVGGILGSAGAFDMADTAVLDNSRIR